MWINRILIVVFSVFTFTTLSSAADFRLNTKTGKTTLVDADIFLIEDSEATWATKKVTAENLAAYIFPYTVGTAANNLVQLNASAQLPAVSGALITGSWTGTLLSGQTTHTGAIQALATELDSAVDLTFSTGLTDTSGTITVTYPVTAEAFSGSGWNGDTGGLARNDAYDYLHLFDTDDDGLPNKVDLSSAGIVKTDADGVLSVATAGTDYESPQPSTLNLTTDTSVSSAQLLANKYITNQGASAEVDITLPAVSYSITRTVLVEEAQIAEINPPSGEAFDLNGTTLTADYCIDSPATVGAKAVFTRMQNASGTWHWSVDTVRGTWVDTGASD